MALGNLLQKKIQAEVKRSMNEAMESQVTKVLRLFEQKISRTKKFEGDMNQAVQSIPRGKFSSGNYLGEKSSGGGLNPVEKELLRLKGEVEISLQILTILYYPLLFSTNPF